MLYTDFKGLKISKLALGTWAMGAGKDWGPNEEKDSVNAINTALQCGINLIDTAPIYGNFRSEELLGKALKGKRDKIIISTKCGLQPAHRAVKFDLSAKAVQAEIENSLRRLQTDYIDIYSTNGTFMKRIKSISELSDIHSRTVILQYFNQDHKLTKTRKVNLK